MQRCKQNNRDANKDVNKDVMRYINTERCKQNKDVNTAQM